MLCPLPQLDVITERPQVPNSPEAVFHVEPHSSTVPEFSKTGNKIFCSVLDRNNFLSRNCVLLKDQLWNNELLGTSLNKRRSLPAEMRGKNEDTIHTTIPGKSSRDYLDSESTHVYLSNSFFFSNWWRK